MITFLISLVLLAAALGAISVHKTFLLHPLKELKRRARGHDHVAARLYPVAAYGRRLQLLLWLIVMLALAGSFVAMSVAAPPVLAFLFISVTIGVAFAWIPGSRVSDLGVKLALLLAPMLLKMVAHLERPLSSALAAADRYRVPHSHTRLYEHEDLIALLEAQRTQSDSRISAETLDMLSHMLSFGTKNVRDVMVPIAKVRQVQASEVISPLLIKDLHDSGFHRFPVHDGEPDRLVGVLDIAVIADLKHEGSVAAAMTADVEYLHEQHPLEQVLDAFHKTGAHLYMVVNEDATIVGIITIEDVLVQLIGYKIDGSFDTYDSRTAVAGSLDR